MATHRERHTDVPRVLPGATQLRTDLAELLRDGTLDTVLIFDIDQMHRLNVELGHKTGDRFIVDLASILRSSVRGSDHVFRWGADELTVVLEHTDARRALSLAERIRQAVADRTEGTVSIGIYAGVPPSPEAAVRVADQAMYAAKGQGKNRIVVGGGEAATQNA